MKRTLESIEGNTDEIVKKGWEKEDRIKDINASFM